MTSFEDFASRNRDMQDYVERHVYGEMTTVEGAGTFITVRGNGTTDEEIPVLSLGQGMRYPKNTNAEVLLLSAGSDPNMKVALLQVPRDKQRDWKENSGGVQSPMDPDKFLEFNEKRTWLNDGAFAFANGTFEIVGGNAIFRCSVVIEGSLVVNGGITAPNYDEGSTNIPPFEE